MQFITPLFFEFEPIKIANVCENGSLQLEVSRFIGQYEKQCLIDVLGDCLAKELADSFQLAEGSFVLKTDATNAIKNLVNGLEYEATNNGNDVIIYGLIGRGCSCGCSDSTCKKRVWKGIVQNEDYFNGSAMASSKSSFIADYIHYYHLLVHRSQTTGTGQQVLAGENSVTVSNFSKRIDSWNSFVFKVQKLYQFLNDHKTDYPSWRCNCNLDFKDKY